MIKKPLKRRKKKALNYMPSPVSSFGAIGAVLNSKRIKYLPLPPTPFGSSPASLPLNYRGSVQLGRKIPILYSLPWDRLFTPGMMGYATW
jgi:hypothetical protein